MASAPARMGRSTRLIGLVVAVGVLAWPWSAAAADWPRFRGPNGGGVAGDDAATPVEFGPDKNLAWRVELPGDGVSSPIVVGDRVIVTAYSGYGPGGGSPLDLVRHLVCLDRRTGKTLWAKRIEAVLPEDSYSGMGVPSHGYASHTPASDGKRIYAFFGKSGVHAYDLDGELVWQRSVGTDSDPRRWGSASSPIVVGDVVVVTAGPERRAIVGLDAATGEERWSAPADSLGSVWGTPATAAIDDARTDVVIGAPGEFWGLNPITGKVRWYSAGVGDDGFNTSVVVSDGVVYAVEGRSGGSMAVRAGGKGDVAATNTVWSGRDANRFGTPLVYRGRLYVISGGVVSCLDAATGTRIYQSRLGDGAGGGRRRGGDYSSPVAADGKIYYVTGGGDVHVFAAGDAFESLCVNHLAADGESFAATPAIADGAIYIRSSRHLSCFRTPAAPAAFHHEDVLGTSLELVVEAADDAAAQRAEAVVLDEIDRLAKVCSTYDPESEVSRWLAAGEARQVSPDLAAILRACDRWREAGHGAFHPGVAVASGLWREAGRAGVAPDEVRVATVAAMLRQPPWTWHGTAVIPRSAVITLDGLAKGAIVDAACAAALGVDGVTGVVVNIGGDLAVRGAMEREVVVASPAPGATGDGVLDRMVVAERAVATSGDAFRGFTVGGRRHSHVIDPRSARPADGIRSATVLTPSAADADALATICCVLAPAESIRLVEAVSGASCLILEADGAVHASRDWPGERFGPRRTHATRVAFAAAPGEATGRAFELVLDVEINRPAGGGRYRRPYVAAWVEDKDGFPVKTLLLWVQRDGQRWLPDLKRWYRADRLRKLAEDTNLVATISEATRQPGKHSVSWDGRDNAGAPLPPGDYTICLEAAREHGTYQFDRRTVTLGEQPFREAFDGGTELKAATLEYRAVEAGR